jgi:hypothetical protein
VFDLKERSKPKANLPWPNFINIRWHIYLGSLGWVARLQGNLFIYFSAQGPNASKASVHSIVLLNVVTGINTKHSLDFNTALSRVLHYGKNRAKLECFEIYKIFILSFEVH